MKYNSHGMNHSSKDSPCPVCGRTKDGDCSFTADKGLVLCYTEGKDGNPTTTANGYYFNGKYSNRYGTDNSRAQYTKKKPRTHHSSAQPAKRLKPAKQIEKAVQLASAHVETKVDDLALMIAEGHETLEQARVTLSEWCKEYRYNEFNAGQLLKAKVKAQASRDMQSASDEDPKWLKEYRLLEDKFSDRLRFNELSKAVELDGEPFDASMAKLQLGIHHNTKLKGNREDLTDSVVMLAQQNSYSPVGEYLHSVHQQYGDSTDILEGLASRHLGTTDPIHEALLRRFLIAAVARAIAPGCKHDCALILQGPQGYGKSTFFKLLASEQWFDDSLGSASDKDEKLKLHRSWIVEWAELETVFRRRDVSQVKAFMSSAVDILRPPYGRSIETLKRPSVIVGTTNQDQFLADTTGNRRFWVIPITQRLDLAQLQEERDHIWAAAVTLYQSGETWWLNEEENKAVDSDRKQYEDTHPWFEPIQLYVGGLNEISTTALLTHGLGIDVSKQSNGDKKKLAGVMQKLGWEKTNNILSQQGQRVRGWKKKNP